MALTGQELLAKLKELDGASKSEVVRAAGYVGAKKDGSERLNYTAFCEAVLEAKGTSFGVKDKGVTSPSGRALGFIAKVQFNGNLLIGKAYTALLDLAPGDEFKISLGKTGRITLIPLNEKEAPATGEAEAPAAPAAEAAAAPEPAVV
jgi:hypothetical protein